MIKTLAAAFLAAFLAFETPVINVNPADHSEGTLQFEPGAFAFCVYIHEAPAEPVLAQLCLYIEQIQDGPEPVDHYVFHVPEGKWTVDAEVAYVVNGELDIRKAPAVELSR